MEESRLVWMLSRRREQNKREVVEAAGGDNGSGRSKMNSSTRKLIIAQTESEGVSQENRVKTYIASIMSNNWCNISFH